MIAAELTNAPGRASRLVVASAGYTCLIAALALPFAGCGLQQPGTNVQTAPPVQARTQSQHNPATVATQQPRVATPARPAPQPARSLSEPTPPPAATRKGAEQLMALNAPARPVAGTATAAPAARPAARATAAANSRVVTGTVAKQLIVKGPPHKPQPERAGMKGLLYLGLALAAIASAVLVLVGVIRGAKPVKVPREVKDDLKAPEGLLFKEPLNLPQENVMVDRS